MSDTVAGSDMGIGLGMVFAILAVLGAVGMLVTYNNHLVAGWSFAVAIVGGVLSVAGIHLFGGDA